MNVKIFSAEMIDAILDPVATIAAIDRAFRGGLYAPPRHHHEMASGSSTATLLIMPAWTEFGSIAAFSGLKVLSVHPNNTALGLASIQGSYILSDGNTGEPLALMDGARLTLHRTAATSAYASGRLARSDVRHMAMIGAGALSPFLVRAHVAARPSIQRISVWNRNHQRAVEVTEKLRIDPFLANINVDAVSDLEQSVRSADVISCATLSKVPLLRGEWLRAGTHVDLVGAYSLEMREADDATLSRAEVFVDAPTCLSEGGDVAVAIKKGALARDAVRADLFALARGEHQGRENDAQITLFKSIGVAIEDLAAAILIWMRREMMSREQQT